MENRIDIAAKAVLVHDEKVLTIRRSASDDVCAGAWEFVGGRLEFGESPRDALKREIKEETGLDARVGTLLYASSFMLNPNRQLIILTYYCSCDGETVRLSEEHQDYLWAGPAQLRQLLLKPILEELEKNDIFSLLEIE